jgi:sec-independent protein translocase protein TatC
MANRIRPVAYEDRLSVVDHLDELRTRLIVCLAIFGAAFAICGWQNDRVLDIVNRPLEQSSLDTEEAGIDPLEQSARYQRQLGAALTEAGRAFRRSAEALRAAEGEGAVVAREAAQANQRAARALEEAARAAPEATERRPVTLGVTEPFVTTFKVAAYAGLLLALPLLLYQLYAFVLPAFTPQERRVALPLMSLVPVLFVLGVLFCYFVILPSATNFLLNFNDENFDILVQARDYYGFAIMTMVLIGLAFQVPVGVLALTRLGVVTPAQLRRNRRYAILVVAIVAAVATPSPDPGTMLLAMGPLILLYEGSILLSTLFLRRQLAREEDDDDEGEAEGDHLSVEPEEDPTHAV